MTIPRASDEAVDAIVIHWKPGPDSFLTRASLSESMAATYPVLRHFPTLLRWEEALLLAEGVARQQTVGMDMRSVSYPASYVGSDRPSTQRPADDEVMLEDGAGNQTRVSITAFETMMVRLFETMIAGAERESLHETQSEWWPRFVDLFRQISERTVRSAL